jgi:GNAT-like C-terminal domain/N-acyltransferase N-terminal domain
LYPDRLVDLIDHTQLTPAIGGPGQPARPARTPGSANYRSREDRLILASSRRWYCEWPAEIGVCQTPAVTTLADLVRDDHRPALADLQSRELPEVEVEIPPTEDLLTRAREVAVPFEDLNPLLAAAAQLRSGPGEELLRLEVGALVAAMGCTDPLPELPAVTPDLVDPPGYFGVLVALLTVPYTRAYHREHAVDEVTSWRTFIDIGRNIAVYRNRHGRPGFDDLGWVTLHLTGQLYDLGRLQVNRSQLGRTFTRLMRERGLDVVEREPCLAVHIPRYSGPMDVAACDRSIARAGKFFPAHFPDESPRYLVCSSWLLDPALAERLPARSNIVAFQHRFTIARCEEPDDEATLIFVFEDPTRALSAYPRSSSLQRAVLEHLDSGGHWHGGRGWRPLVPDHS